MEAAQTNDDGVASARDAEEARDALNNLSPETPCPYLPGLQTRCEIYSVDHLDGAFYERLLAHGFRRSGGVVFRPRCRSCDECRSLRVPVADFTPSRSMRRVKRINQDVRLEVGPAFPTDEKFELFRRYLDFQHDDTMTRTYEAFVNFLYESPTETREFRYWLGNRLVGVSLADQWAGGLSSVYMFFEPDFAIRSLGTFSVLAEIEYCAANHIPYYYLGYYVAGSKTMSYKARFRPSEVLIGDDRWVPLRPGGA